MAEKLSRRTMVRGAVGGALFSLASPLSLAQAETKPQEDSGLDRRLDEAEKKLAHPLSGDVRKLAREQLKNLEKECADRLKTKLTDNSEPCFTYLPTGRKS